MDFLRQICANSLHRWLQSRLNHSPVTLIYPKYAMRSTRLLSHKLLFCAFVFLSTYSFSQVAIGTTGTPTPNPKAVLLLTGANQGFIIPIVNSKGSVNATGSEKGMVVFDDSDKKVYFFDGGAWNQVGGGGGSQGIQISGNLVSLNASPGSNFGLANNFPSTPQKGLLLSWNGTQWETTTNMLPANGMVLTWNGTTNSWEPKAPIAVSSTPLPNGQLFVGNVSNVATATAPSTFPLSNFGAATAAVSLGNNKITNLATPTVPTDGANKAYVDANVLPSLSASQLLSNNGSNVGITVAGDLTLAVAGTTGTFTIANNAVTNVKLAGSIAASKLIGTDINTVGTITSGVWNGTKVGEAFGGTNQTTYATGDILYASASNTLSKLPIGATNQVLTVNAGLPVWSAGGSGWSLTGNAGTNPVTDFIGTKDAQPLRFATGVGGVERMRIDATGNVGIGTSSPSSSFEVLNAGTTSTAVTLSTTNTANTNATLLANKNATGGASIVALANGGAEAINVNQNGSGYALDVIVNNASSNNSAIIASHNGPGTVLTINTTGTGLAASFSGGKIKIVDGSQGLGKVLTSDAAGVASWQSGGSGWVLGGNTGTIDGAIGTGTNYIGTKDNVPLNFIMNNLKAGRIDNLNASTFFGSVAGNINTGGQNAGFGSQALEKNTTGSTNAAFGQLALNNNTTGNFNVAVGAISMTSNTTGGNNIAVGVQANNSNTIGSGNTAIGYNANYANVSSSFNTIMGIDAAFNNTGANNTALGRQALFTNTTGNNNTAVGYKADVAATVANATAIGANASAGTSNTIQLGDALVTTVNVGTGTTAKLVAGGLQITGGTLGAGKVLTSDASGNATWQSGGGGWGLTGNAGTVDGTNFIGTTDAIPLNFKVNNLVAGRIESAVGTANTLYGYQAGSVNTGIQNAAVGYQAMQVNTAGQRNAAFGYRALANNTTGNGNTGVGQNALSLNTTGGANAAFGTSALANNTGSTNTAVGNSALFANTTASDNAAVGTQALSFNTTGSSNSALGSASLIQNTTGFNNTGVGLNALQTNTTGSSNTAIGYKADVSSVAFTNATAIGANASVTASNTIQVGDNLVTTVNVGTGTTAKLVAGGLQITGGTLGVGKVLTSDASGNATWQSGGGGWGITGNAGTDGGSINFVGTTDIKDLVFKTNNLERVRITSNGNLGIGTSTANAPLQFANSLANRKIVFYDGSNNDHQFIGFGLSPAVLRYQTDNTGSDHVFFAGTSSTTSNELMRISGTGAVSMGGGISIGSGMNVTGTVNLNGTVNVTNNVGIGAATANAPLQFGNATVNRKIVMYEGVNNDHQFIGFGVSPAVLRYQTDNASTDHVFYTGASSTTSTELMRIKGNGNVGIGTTTPTAKLEVAGQVKIADGTQGAGKVLTSDATGLATWQATAGGVFPVNTIVKGNSTGTAQVASQIFDDGTSVSLTTAPTTNVAKLIVQNEVSGGPNGTVGGTKAIRAVVADNGSSQVTAIEAQVTGANTGQQTGVFSNVTGTSGFNRAVVAGASNSATTNIGVDAYASTATTGSNYGLQSYIGNATNNYGLKINASGTGTKYGVYSSGEDINYFSGNVGIGTTTPGAALDIASAASGMRINSWYSAGASICGIPFVGLNLYRNNADNVWKYTNTHGSIGGAVISFNDCAGDINSIIFSRTNTPGTGGANATLTESMRITQNGRVGIGTTAPGYPLEVIGSVTTNYFSGSNLVVLNQPQGSSFISSGTFTSGGTGGTSASTSIKSQFYVAAEGFVSISDKRIKKDILVADAAKDLETLMKLKVSNYHYIDEAGRGSQLKKGFIAQEVKEVFPEAVITNAREVIPSVYARASKIIKGNDDVYSICTPGNHSFVIGDKVKLFTPKGEVIEQVMSVEGTNCFSLRTTKISSLDSVFVYGKEVSDFHSVDYDQVHTLSISAIQELARKVESLEKENAILKERQKTIDSLQAKAIEQTKKMAELESSKTELESLKAEIANIKRVLGMEAKITTKKKE